jgi:hypothetical protein
LGRLVELSPFYVFAYSAMLLVFLDKDRRAEYMFMLFSAACILVFYIFWRNFQCRYITAVIVPLVVLSARAQVYAFDKIRSMPIGNKRLAALAGFIFIMAYFTVRTLYIDFAIAVPNGTCYF